jgi:hypothetical protein
MKGTLRNLMVQYKTLRNTESQPNVLVANSLTESDGMPMFLAVLKNVMDPP